MTVPSSLSLTLPAVEPQIRHRFFPSFKPIHPPWTTWQTFLPDLHVRRMRKTLLTHYCAEQVSATKQRDNRALGGGPNPIGTGPVALADLAEPEKQEVGDFLVRAVSNSGVFTWQDVLVRLFRVGSKWCDTRHH